MKLTITEQQQLALIKKQAVNRLSRYQLAEKLNLSKPTIKSILDGATPLTVRSKTFTAVNNYLLEDL